MIPFSNVYDCNQILRRAVIMTDYDSVIHETIIEFLRNNPERIHFHKNDRKTLSK